MWYAIKLHYRKATVRCRMDIDHGDRRIEDLKRLARTAWPDLVDKDIRLMYYDDEESICPLIEESWPGAVELGVEANPSKEWNNRLKLYVKLREDDEEAVTGKITDVAEGNGADGDTSKRHITVLLCDCEKVKKLIEESTNLKFTLGSREIATEAETRDGSISLTTEESWQVPAEEAQ
ncbi:hypothetical protein FOZ60_006402 [Perkinsus olseni]|uniref:Uncharacterized protein n=1 Tax=Perkinsus olseni TaxID=32597 RepID=A0A7J6NNX3_PEROL|nr:hypothetical protein FOZ60_006402 [Perkinsus olseni]